MGWRRSSSTGPSTSRHWTTSWGAVIRGEGGVFVVQGDQGIGESALLRETVRRAQSPQGLPDFRFVQDRCLDQIGVDNAYGPVVDVLTALQPAPRRSPSPTPSPEALA